MNVSPSAERALWSRWPDRVVVCPRVEASRLSGFLVPSGDFIVGKKSRRCKWPPAWSRARSCATAAKTPFSGASGAVGGGACCGPETFRRFGRCKPVPASRRAGGRADSGKSRENFLSLVRRGFAPVVHMRTPAAMYQNRNFCPSVPDPVAGVGFESPCPVRIRRGLARSLRWEIRGGRRRDDQPVQRIDQTRTEAGVAHGVQGLSMALRAPRQADWEPVARSAECRRRPATRTNGCRKSGVEKMKDHSISRLACSCRVTQASSRGATHRSGRLMPARSDTVPGGRRVWRVARLVHPANAFPFANIVRKGMCARAHVRLQPIYAF